MTTSLPVEFKKVKFIYKNCSVTDEPKLRACMTQIKNDFGCIDIVVNSVGVADEKNVKQTIDINYVGSFFFEFHK